MDRWRATHTHENTGHQQSCASERIEPTICTPEFRIMTDHELLTIVLKAWGVIICAKAGTSRESNPSWTRLSWCKVCFPCFSLSFLYKIFSVSIPLFTFTRICWLFLQVAGWASLVLVSTLSSPRCDIHSITIELSICQALPLLSHEQWEAQERDNFTS